MAQFLRPASRIAQIVFAIFLVYFTLRLAHYHLALVTFPYSSSLREGAMMTSTDALVKGLNPYDMSLQPRYMNQYGIVYPLLVWPLAKIFGTTILIHRAVVAFFILASCVLIFFVLKKMAVPVLLGLWAVLMLYASFLYPGTSTASIDPGAPATFFFLLTLFVPWFCQYSYKSLIVSVLFGVLAFYTKLYAFLGVPVMLSYLFILISKKKGLCYGILLLFLLLISIATVNHIFPAYFDDCLFSQLNMSPAWLSMERLHMQIVLYSHLHKWTLILIGVFILGYGFKNIGVMAIYIKRLLRFARNDTAYDFPLVLYAGTWSASVLYFSMGRNNGATLWYFFQLLSPFLLIGAAWLFGRYAFWPIVCVPFLVLNLYTITSGQDYKLFSKSLAGWPEISLLISQHQHILNSPLIAPLLIEQNKEIVDNGQAEYFLPGGRRDYWMKGWLKEDERIYAQLMLFFEDIRSMVENKKYDLIILQPKLLPLGVADDIQKYYKYEGALELYAPQDHRPYEITVWKPL